MTIQSALTVVGPNSDPGREPQKNKPKEWRKTRDKDLKLRVSSGVFYVRKTFRKLAIPELFETTEETQYGAAREKADLLIVQHSNKWLGIDDSAVLVRKAEKTVGQVIDWILENYTPLQRFHTQRKQKLYLGRIKAFAGQVDIKLFNHDRFAALLKFERKKAASRARPGRKPRRTYMDFAKYANLLISQAYEQKWVGHWISFKDPDKAFKKILLEKKRNFRPLTDEEKEILEAKSSRCFTLGELEALWNSIVDETTGDQFSLAFEDIMRPDEIFGLDWPRVNRDTGELTLGAEHVKTGSKTGQGRRFFLSPHSLERLRARWKRMHEEVAARSLRLAEIPGEWSAATPICAALGITSGAIYKAARKGKIRRLEAAAGCGRQVLFNLADVRERYAPRISPFVFPNALDPARPCVTNQRAWAAVKRRAGILEPERARWYDLRHTALTFACVGPEELSPEERKPFIKNPAIVAKTAGTSLKMLDEVYLKVGIEHTREVTGNNDVRKLFREKK